MRRIFSMLTIVGMLAACGPSGEENQTEDQTMENQEMTDETPAATEGNDMGNEATTETTDNMSQGQEVEVSVDAIGETMTTMAYSPERIEVPAGSVVNLTLNNTAESAAMIHNLVVIKAGKQTEVSEAALAAGSSADYIPENENIIAATPLAQPGETVTVTFNAPDKPGTYQFICTYPGHTAMKGVFLVK